MNTEYSKLLMSKDFNIIDEEQRIVEGIVTDDKIDIDGHIIDKMGFQDALIDFLPWGNIRDQHGLPAAKLLSTPDWNKFQVKVIDDGTWNRIRGGLYKGFSIGIRVLGVEAEDVAKFTDSSFEGLPRIVVNAIKESGIVFRITKMVLGEVSIVDRPANPRALITTVKNLQTGSDVPYMPIIGTILKAQNHEGEIQMNENTQQVENTQPDTNTENNEVQVTEDKSVEIESRIANLEKSISDLAGAVKEVVNVRDEVKTIQESLAKALQMLASKVEENTAEAVVEIKTEPVVTSEPEKEVTVDVEKQITDAVAKAVDQIAASFEKKMGEVFTKLESTSTERVGGVNGGTDETSETQKSIQTPKKATYKDVASALANKIGLKE